MKRIFGIKKKKKKRRKHKKKSNRIRNECGLYKSKHTKQLSTNNMDLMKIVSKIVDNKISHKMETDILQIKFKNNLSDNIYNKNTMSEIKKIKLKKLPQIKNIALNLFDMFKFDINVKIDDNYVSIHLDGKRISITKLKNNLIEIESNSKRLVINSAHQIQILEIKPEND